MVEPQIVVLAVAGSSPVGHPFFPPREAATVRTQFHDRDEAGRLLVEKLTAYANRADVLVLALPRGGVPVAAQVARELNAPLDVFVVRKLGFPGHPELAMGAIATGGIRVLNADVVDSLQVPDDVIEAVAADERVELMRRERAYRDDLPPPDVREKQSSWSMTVSRLDQQCSRPLRRFDNRKPAGLLSRCRPSQQRLFSK